MRLRQDSSSTESLFERYALFFKKAKGLWQIFFQNCGDILNEYIVCSVRLCSNRCN